jgi:hypothetical protein
MGCAFCVHQGASGRSWRLRRPEGVAAEMGRLADLHATRAFRLGGSYTPGRFYEGLIATLRESRTDVIEQQPPPPPQLTPEQLAEIQEQERKQKQLMAGIIAIIVLLVALLGVAIYFLLQPETPTDKIRDVFIIVVALETLVIGVALIVLVVQLASLINLLQNEVRPILHATSETVNTLRGTAEFLGENVVEPVIKLNGYLAGLKRMLELLGIKPK